MTENEGETDKGEYKHFMLKEINEQPDTVKKCIDEYVDSLKKNINILNFPIEPKKLTRSF